MPKQPIQVGFTATFKKDIKRLRKKYPRIQQDVQPLVNQLIEGETLGDQIPSTGYTVYKVRLPNRDAKRGKRGGYRVVYYIQTSTHIVLLTIYAKVDRADVSAGDIQDIISTLPDDDTD